MFPTLVFIASTAFALYEAQSTAKYVAGFTASNTVLLDIAFRFSHNKFVENEKNRQIDWKIRRFY